MSQDLDQQVRKAVMDFCRQAPRRYPFFSIVLGILILVLLIWYIPQWQVPASGLSLKDRLHQINENRKTMAQIAGGVFILWGLYIAWVRSKAMRDQAEVDREQQLTDLYVKAIEQLGSEKLQIRLGGIYALERIARESPKDHWTIMEVLTAFVRENAPLKEEAPAEEAAAEKSRTGPDATEKLEPKVPSPTTPKKPSTDIQAVLTVLGRTAIPYSQKGEKRSLDLRATHLVGADLRQANLHKVLFEKTNLQEADLRETNLQEAKLERANIQEAKLCQADLRRAHLSDAILQRADLKEADLQGADLVGANLQGAKLPDANLQGMDLRRVILQRADLQRANLQVADLRRANIQEAQLWKANLQRAHLSDANLKRVDLLDANLQETQLWRANLKGGRLQKANLKGAVIREADLKGADLAGANLQGADLHDSEGLTAKQVAEAIWDETTCWPKSFSPPPPRKDVKNEKE